MDRFESDLLDMSDGWAPDDFNWSVWEHDKARNGDKFFMVRSAPLHSVRTPILFLFIDFYQLDKCSQEFFLHKVKNKIVYVP